MSLGQFPAVQEQDGAFFVVSEQGKVLGKFDTVEGAEDFKRNYSALKSYSATVGEAGNEEAMKQFKQKIRKELIGG